METVFIQAFCCPPPERPGAAFTTTLTGHLAQKVNCELCGKEYTVDYEPHEPLRIQDFEGRLASAAQRAVNHSHPKHIGFVGIHRL